MKSLIRILVIIGTQLSICSSFANANSEIINIERLNQHLQNQSAGWVAKDNWINHLSKVELKHLFGLREVPNQDVQFEIKKESKQYQALPVTQDWRNFQGKNWVSPILNQGNCGSCVSFAAVGVLETQVNISSMISNLNRKLSTQYLFGCGGGSCDYGWYPGSAANFLQKSGTTDEACLPYSSGATGKDVRCEHACMNASNRTQKISGYTTPTRGSENVEAVKAALLKGPVVTTLRVYEDFLAYHEGVYKRTSSKAVGGHAVSIVGYDDVTQAWIIRNSWGEDWGEKGFAHVSYSDDSGISDSTWLYDVSPNSGYVGIMAPKDYDYLSGNYIFSATSTFPKTATIKFTIEGEKISESFEFQCLNAVCDDQVDTTKFTDGFYEIETSALDLQGNLLGSSTKELFYIINGTPKMTLDFSGHNGLNLQKPLKARVEFDVKSTSAPVPMNSLELHIKNLTSGKEIIRKTSAVEDSMVTGWRTNLVENGKYELWMVGKVITTNNAYSISTEHVVVTVQN